MYFLQELDVCLLANICNHTDTPECGKEKNSLEIRVFLDECDRIEYNCDYKKGYVTLLINKILITLDSRPYSHNFLPSIPVIWDFTGQKLAYVPFWPKIQT